MKSVTFKKYLLPLFFFILIIAAAAFINNNLGEEKQLHIEVDKDDNVPTSVTLPVNFSRVSFFHTKVLEEAWPSLNHGKVNTE